MIKLKVKGTPREKGLIHGESLAVQIKQLFEIRFDILKSYWSNSKKDFEDIYKVIDTQLSFLQKYPNLFAEFNAISESSNLSLEKLAILVNYTDLRDFSPVQDEGCSMVYYSKDNTILCGQTWDMHGSASDFVTYIYDETLETHILTVAGCPALCGINKHGLSMFINNLSCFQTHDQGTMWPMLVKGVLDNCSNVETAKNYFVKNLPSSGHNYLMCDHDSIIDIETTGKNFDVIFNTIHAKEDTFFHTNHYIGDLKEFEIKSRLSNTTGPRFNAIQNYFVSNFGKILKFEQLKKDIFGGKVCNEICMPKVLTEPNKSATLSGFVIDYSQKNLFIYDGDRLTDHNSVKISL